MMIGIVEPVMRIETFEDEIWAIKADSFEVLKNEFLVFRCDKKFVAIYRLCSIKKAVRIQ